MKTFTSLVFLALLIIGISTTGCKKEDCETCDGLATQTMNGQVLQSASVPGYTVCGADLEEIKRNPSVVQTQVLLGDTIITTTDYTCK